MVRSAHTIYPYSFCSSLSSVYLYFEDGRAGFYIGAYGKITLPPYLYLFSVLLISFYPLLKLNTSKIKEIHANNYEHQLYVISVLFIVASILPFVENMIYLIKTLFFSEISSVVSATFYTKRLENIVTWHSFAGKKLNTILLCFKQIIPLLFFFWLSKDNKHFAFKILLIIPLLNGFTHDFLTASRANLFMDWIYIMLSMFIFKHTLSKKMWSLMKRVNVMLVASLFSFTIIISVARFGESLSKSYQFSIWSWISIYLGEATLRFNVFMWNIKHYMFGDNTFSGIKYILGFNTTTDLLEREFELMSKSGIILNVFHTFIGDFYGDFGPFGSLLLVVLFILPLILFFDYNKSSVPFYSILYISIWYSICVYGITYFAYKVSFLNYSLIIQLIFIAFLWVLGRTKNERHPVP